MNFVFCNVIALAEIRTLCGLKPDNLIQLTDRI